MSGASQKHYQPLYMGSGLSFVTVTDKASANQTLFSSAVPTCSSSKSSFLTANEAEPRSASFIDRFWNIVTSFLSLVPWSSRTYEATPHTLSQHSKTPSCLHEEPGSSLQSTGAGRHYR